MKGCLVVVDYQNDFVTGSLGFEAAQQIGNKIAERIRQARADGWQVVFTLDTHDENYLKSHEGQLLPVEHCIQGTDGWLIAEPVRAEIRDEDLRFEKGTFGSDKLYEHLRNNPVDVVELCGLVTDICVTANTALVRTALPEAEIHIDPVLTASADARKYEAALETLRSLQVDVRKSLSAE